MTLITMALRAGFIASPRSNNVISDNPSVSGSLVFRAHLACQLQLLDTGHRRLGWECGHLPAQQGEPRSTCHCRTSAGHTARCRRGTWDVGLIHFHSFQGQKKENSGFSCRGEVTKGRCRLGAMGGVNRASYRSKENVLLKEGRQQTASIAYSLGRLSSWLPSHVTVRKVQC